MFYKFKKKKHLVVVLKLRIFQTKNQLKNYTNQLLGNLRKEKYTQLLQTIFVVLTLLYAINRQFDKEFVFYYVLLIILVNMHGSFKGIVK